MNIKCYILLGASITLAAFILYFYGASVQGKREMLAAKMKSLEYNVDHVCNLVDYFIDRDGGWDVEKHKGTFVVLTESIDAMPEVYAELMDCQLNTISQRIVPETDHWQFDPKQHPDLMEHIQSEGNGYYTVVHKISRHLSVEVSLHWRWVPIDDRYDNRILLLVGVSMYSINTEVVKLIVLGAVLLIIIPVVFSVIYLMLLTGNVKGDKKEHA